ncbi:type II CAAX prenyl endopeptidase Rce1 family protein [Streptococcus pneumoniae]|uniref:type II CAAX prenyl endopeptidase Rce1 family protein n=1 Tax=Streptococcus pneumoniae TaxID=1313 RepID=UPI002240FC94|nr:CPBP family glutamic-type intramembrane protease [Streptococcus pneumoniae]
MILSHRDPISLLYYSLIGFFFALVYRFTDNLRLTILCHSFFLLSQSCKTYLDFCLQLYLLSFF